MNIIINGLPMYAITLNQTPPSWNRIQGEHWRYRHSLKNEWAEEFGWLATKIPKNVKHIYLAGEIFYGIRVKRDADNPLIWKFTQDALVTAGIIPDDTPEFVTTFKPKLSYDADNPRTEIMVIVDREGTSTCEVVIMGGNQ